MDVEDNFQEDLRVSRKVVPGSIAVGCDATDHRRGNREEGVRVLETDSPEGLWICLSVRGCILRWVTCDGGVTKKQLGGKSLLPELVSQGKHQNSRTTTPVMSTGGTQPLEFDDSTGHLPRVTGWCRSTYLHAMTSSGIMSSSRIYKSTYRVPHYSGLNTCLEFFRSHDLLDWSTLIFE